MTQVENKLHVAVIQAVALMLRTPSREPEFHEALTILRQALMDYAPSPATGSAVPASTVAPDWKTLLQEALTQMCRVVAPDNAFTDLVDRMDASLTASPPIASASTVAPSPVGEVTDANWIAAADEIIDCLIQQRTVKSNKPFNTYGECVRTRAYELAAAQAPKPASAGGDSVVSGWVNVYSDGSFGHLHESEALARSQERGKGITIARTVFVSSGIAAEANTAKVLPRDKPFCTLPGNPAADRLAQTVTDDDRYFLRQAGRILKTKPGLDALGDRLLAIEGRVRARESAPAQEGAVTDDNRGGWTPTHNPLGTVAFRAGLLACREYMARFVNAQSPEIAASIRANWWPALGDDPGVPRLLDFHEVADGGENGPWTTSDRLTASIEALPYALQFLESQNVIAGAAAPRAGE